MIRIIFIISTLFVSFLFEGCSLFTENKPVLLEEETLFEKGRYYYLSSLNFNLDQTKTNIAINKFNQLIKEYPDSSKIKEAYRLLNNLLKKIEKKNYCIANSYFIMRRYQASLIYFQDLIKNFPGSHFKEKVMYKICIAQYKLYNKKDFVKSYNDYMKNFSYSYNAKKLKVLYKKLKQL